MAVIEVYADIWCPFTHVGLRLVAERTTRIGGEPTSAIHVRAWPLELVNGAPMDPTRAWDHAQELREQVAPDMFQGLLAIHLPRHHPARTQPRWRARTSVSDEIGEQVSFALRDALFEAGLDISDHEVLRDIARCHRTQ